MTYHTIWIIGCGACSAFSVQLLSLRLYSAGLPIPLSANRPHGSVQIGQGRSEREMPCPDSESQGAPDLSGCGFLMLSGHLASCQPSLFVGIFSAHGYQMSVQLFGGFYTLLSLTGRSPRSLPDNSSQAFAPVGDARSSVQFNNHILRIFHR